MKKLLIILPILIFGAFYVKHIYDKNKMYEREIAPEEAFLVGKWANVKAIAKDGNVTEYEQGPKCFILRRDVGSLLRKYEGFKPAGYRWLFSAQDSILKTFKTDADTTRSKVRFVSEDILVLTSLEDSVHRVQMRYTGEVLEFPEEKIRKLGL